MKVEIGHGKSARDINEPTVERVTAAAAQMARPIQIVRVGYIRWARHRADADAVRVGPAKIAFQTEDKGAVLPIVASQRATDNAVRRRSWLGDNAVIFDARAAP